jgi:hypothetical protein
LEDESCVIAAAAVDRGSGLPTAINRGSSNEAMADLGRLCRRDLGGTALARRGASASCGDLGGERRWLNAPKAGSFPLVVDDDLQRLRAQAVGDGEHDVAHLGGQRHRLNAPEAAAVEEVGDGQRSRNPHMAIEEWSEG